MNKKGLALILGFVLIVVLSFLGGVMISRAASEAKIAQGYLEAAQAFWLAEAGLNTALDSLRADYSLSTVPLTACGAGAYLADIVSNPDGSRSITAYGCVPAADCKNSPLLSRAKRIIKADAQNSPSAQPPANFFDNVLYGVGGIAVS
jgi:Tfp pilus assembly protein PilX